MRAGFQSALAVVLPLVASCSPSKTASTQPAAEKPKGVLEFRVLASKSDADAYKFNDYRETLVQQGEVSPPEESGCRWLVIRNPTGILKITDLKDGFGAAQKETPLIVERRGEGCYVLARTADEYVMTRSPGSTPWSVKTARVIRSTRGYAGVGIDLDDAGKALLEKLGQAHPSKPLGVFLDDCLVMRAAAMDILSNGLVIHGAFSPTEADELVKLLQKAAQPQDPRGR